MARYRKQQPEDIPASEPSNSTTLGAGSAGFELLFPFANKRAKCAICDRQEDDILAHIQAWHGMSAEDYERRVRSLKHLPPPPPEKEKRTRVTQKDIEEHPGGREGIIVEKNLADDEKTLYREDIVDIAQRYNMKLPVGFQVVQLAYDMTQARRCRKDIDEARRKTDGKVWDADLQDRLSKLSSAIQSTLRDLQKIKENQPVETEKPEVLFQQERAAAEKFIKERLGELDEVCPSCGQPIVLPALPHWAFQPVESESGRGWMVWSPELWWLVSHGHMRVWQMALTLRTSPEFLKITAQRRGVVWPETIDQFEEERLLRAVLNERDREARLDMGVDPEFKIELLDQKGEPVKETVETETLALPSPEEL